MITSRPSSSSRTACGSHIPCTRASLALSLAAACLAAACATGGAPGFSQASLPEVIKVPAGHQVVLETVGVGEITYECREKAGAPGQLAWEFVGPEAVLKNRAGQSVGGYFGPPATWQAADGSRITGTQLAIAPAGAGNLPYQLVKASPAVGEGLMQGVTYVQRVALKGGVAPALPCAAGHKGQREFVPYQADYIFWKAG